MIEQETEQISVYYAISVLVFRSKLSSKASIRQGAFITEERLIQSLKCSGYGTVYLFILFIYCQIWQVHGNSVTPITAGS